MTQAAANTQHLAPGALLRRMPGRAIIVLALFGAVSGCQDQSNPAPQEAATTAGATTPAHDSTEPGPDDTATILGMTLKTAPPSPPDARGRVHRGVLVTAFDKGSLGGANEHVTPGLVIHVIDNHAITSAADFAKQLDARLAAGQPMTFLSTFQPNGERHILFFQLREKPKPPPPPTIDLADKGPRTRVIIGDIQFSIPDAAIAEITKPTGRIENPSIQHRISGFDPIPVDGHRYREMSLGELVRRHENALEIQRSQVIRTLALFITKVEPPEQPRPDPFVSFQRIRAIPPNTHDTVVRCNDREGEHLKEHVLRARPLSLLCQVTHMNGHSSVVSPFWHSCRLMQTHDQKLYSDCHSSASFGENAQISIVLRGFLVEEIEFIGVYERNLFDLINFLKFEKLEN